ncbi:galactokinase [Weissella bombi]|uniref:Galactokinase n=1 Tax=Weissella bombi TaxID=1505725 RepID=A0A1C3Z222_9LACO|nr:galactokinase [Weissella bombi]SCB76333.1 galactokinase [Weissella bombi]
MTLTKELGESFQRRFGHPAEHFFFSPGRVNLIGEHTDYNGGHVFPAAISVGTYAAVSLRDDDEIHAFSANFKDAGVVTFAKDDLDLRAYDSWVKYVRGVISELGKLGHEVPRGFNLAIVGDMPTASGLSSSASLELLIGVMLNDLFDYGMDTLSLVKLGQAVENDYLGLQTGIMDQFAIAFGQEKQAIFLDTNSMEYEMVPADFGDYDLVIMTTNKKRELVDSKYNERRAETQKALEELQAVTDIKALGELTSEEFEKIVDHISSPVNQRRARHAVTENERTVLAKAALSDHDMVRFGELLTSSHNSLRDDYEVTGIELDTLVDAALAQPGVLGARMTGAGFGGSALALVAKSESENFVAAVDKIYNEKIGYQASFLVADIVDGTHAL